MCLPGAARSEHGVEHASDELPSSVAAAPPGLLKMLTSGGTAGRNGAVARSVLGAGSAIADFTASFGTVLTGSAGAGFAAPGSGLAGGVLPGSPCPTRASPAAGPTGLGLASPGATPGATPGEAPGATPGATVGTGTGGTAATGDSAFGTAAACSPLSGGWEPGKCHEPNCEPTNASNPAAARTANRNVTNRGIDFHPLVAPQAFSSDSMNSWQLR